MKKLLLYSFFLCTGNVCLSQSVDKWVFHGVTIEEDMGCITKGHTKYEMFWMWHDELYKLRRDSINKNLKQRYSPNYFSVTTVLAKKGKATYIALVERRRTCTGSKAKMPIITIYKYFYGDSEESILRQAEVEKKLYPLIVSYKIIQLINSEDAIAKLENENPHIKLNTATKEEKINYDGLEARLINKTEGKVLVLAQFTNLKKDKTAIVVVTPLGRNSEVEILQPGEKLTKKYDGEELQIQVKHIDPLPTKEISYDYIKMLKDWLGSKVKVKDGKLIQQKRTSVTCMCVRG